MTKVDIDLGYMYEKQPGARNTKARHYDDDDDDMVPSEQLVGIMPAMDGDMPM